MDRKARIQAILKESSERQSDHTSKFTAALVTVFALGALFVYSGYIYSRGLERGVQVAAEYPEGSVPATWQIISTEEPSSFTRPTNFDIKPLRKPVNLYKPVAPLDI